MQKQALDAITMAGCALTRPNEAVAQDLVRLHDLLVKWQKVQNLVSRETLNQIWDRHIADSLQLVDLVPTGTKRIVDLGSGGGFPALPLAIAFKDADIGFTLVEANSRKVAFLRAVARELGLNLKVVDERIDSFVSRETSPVDLITARALASLDQLFGFSHPIWSAKTRALFHKGREHVEEMTESDARWRYDVVKHPSTIDETGVILEISNLQPRSE